KDHAGTTIVTDSVTSDELHDFLNTHGLKHHRFSCVPYFVVSPVFSVPAVFLSLLFAVAPVFFAPPVSPAPSVLPVFTCVICVARTFRESTG
ncbi:hypothetical protein, partial [Alistipes finegoldii]|uniref:hypothetical protein n=1 Tax=Alistipes finegoldii TaxID=214856 RepID=UPI003AB81614